MNLKLYGICFKLRGGPDILGYVLDNEPVPVPLMEQIIAQMKDVTPQEEAFAKKLDSDWKNAFNERVPLITQVGENGGYEITCTVPDELLDAAARLTGLESGKLIEQYTEYYLKNVFGVDAPVVSVSMEQEEETVVKVQAPSQGFDLSSLGEEPEAPAFEDVAAFAEMNVETENPLIDQEESALEDPLVEVDYPEEEYTDGGQYGEDEIPIEGGQFPEDEFPDDMDEPPEDGVSGEEPEEEDPVKAPEDKDEEYKKALTGIYGELVTNIKERELDKKLGLRIGG